MSYCRNHLSVCVWLIGFVALSAGLLPQVGSAQVVSWIEAAGGNFSDGSNWTGGATPSPTMDANFNIMDSYTVDFTTSPTNNRLLIPWDNVTFDLAGETYTLTDPTNTGFEQRSIIVGRDTGEVGELTLLGGGLLSGQEMIIGLNNNSTGTLNVEAGSTVSSTQSFIGFLVGSTGIVNVSGTGSKWISGKLLVGNTGTGTLNIESGGAVESNGFVSIAKLSGLTGTSTINRGSWTITEDLFVGEDGNGILSIELGTVSSTITRIGHAVGSTGTVTVARSSSLVSPIVFVGSSGDGTLNIESSSTVLSINAYIGHNSGSNGTATITGFASKWTLISGLSVGGSPFSAGGTGTLNITDNGIVDVKQVAKVWGTGEINLNRGTLQTKLLEIVDTGTMNVINATVTGRVSIDSVSKVFAQSSATFNKNTSSDFFVNNGEVNTEGTATFNLPVSGSGTFTGSGTNVFNALVSPGNNAAEVAFSGDVALGSTATLAMELGGTTLGSEYDHLDIAGLFSADGTLSLYLINGFNPALGHTFDLLDFGAITGSFSDIRLPSLSAGLQWKTDDLLSSGVVEVVQGLAGDFDVDGDVDGADFLTWQRDASVGNLTEWQSNYGTVAISSAASTAVPEPPASIVLMTGFVALLLHRKE